MHNCSNIYAQLSSDRPTKSEDGNNCNKVILKSNTTFIGIVMFCLFNLGSLYAQNPGFEINYPGPHAESAWSMTETSDGGFVMTGFQGITVGQSNIALRKVDAEGEELWLNFLGNGGSNMGFSIIENAWGNLVVAGRTNETSPPPIIMRPTWLN